MHWPDSHEFRPDSPEHLRAYLLCKAGHRKVREINVAYSDHNPQLAKLTALAIEAAIKEAGAIAFVRPDAVGGRVAVYTPKSVNWTECNQKDFAKVAEAVEQIIEDAIGIKADDLLKETQRAA
jgi:hypothetical protein